MEITGKQFLITGGVSLIGSHLAERLLAHGAARVVLFDNLSLNAADIVRHLADDKRVRIVRGDVLRLAPLADAMAGVDGVFSLAALLTLPMSQDPALGLEVNITGVRNTLDAARLAGAKKVVLASSIAVYGAETELREASTPLAHAGQSPPFVLYAASKLIGENLGRWYAGRYDLEFNAVRFSTVYGERQHARGVNALHILDSYQKLLAGEAPVIIGDGTEVHDYIHAEDAAEGCIAAMARGVSGSAYNISTSVATSIAQIVALVTKEAGSGIAPEFRADTRAAKGASTSSLSVPNDLARTELDWSPKIPIGVGISRLLAWYQAQHKGAQ
jgi:UDP-glucose 4-epimerase